MPELMSMASKFLKGGGSLSKAAITTRIIGFPRALAVIHSFLTHCDLDESSDHNMSATSCLDSAWAISTLLDQGTVPGIVGSHHYPSL